MQKEFKFITGAIGIGQIERGIAHVSIPVIEPKKDKTGFKVIGTPWVVTSKKEFWKLDAENQEALGIYAKSLPKFGPVESRWWELERKRFLEWSEYTPDIRKEIFEPIKKALVEHIDFYSDGYADVVACWVMGTYIFPIFTAYPYLFLSGPRGSGKTKLLDVIRYLAFNAVPTSNTSVSSLFRIIESNQATLLIDEAEKLGGYGDDSDMRLILNAGYKTGYPVMRSNKDSLEPEMFDVYSPKVIASINQVNPTTASRGININMIKTASRKKGNQRVTDFSGDWIKLRSALYRYLLCHVFKVKELYEGSDKVNKLQCRKNELWAPILSIALSVSEDIFEVVAGMATNDSKDEEGVIDDWHAALLKGLKEMVSSHASYQLSEIKEAMLRYLETDEKDKVTSRWVGSALTRFGFKRGIRLSTGTTYYVNPGVVEDLIKRYQLIENVDSVDGEDKNLDIDELLSTAEEVFGTKSS